MSRSEGDQTTAQTRSQKFKGQQHNKTREKQELFEADPIIYLEQGAARLQPSPDSLPALQYCGERCRTPLQSTSSRFCGSCWRLCCSATPCWWEHCCLLAGRRISWCSNDNSFPAPAVLGWPEAPGSTAQLVPHICSAHRMAPPSSCTNSPTPKMAARSFWLRGWCSLLRYRGYGRPGWGGGAPLG